MNAMAATVRKSVTTTRSASVTIGELNADHRERIAAILEATGSFRAAEIDVALELFDESMAHADRTENGAGAGACSYEFIGAFTAGGELAGYACFGATPGTEGTYDLYWIAVHPECQGAGAGSRLVSEVERILATRGARLLVVETSARDDYEATRRFYERRGYAERVRVRDFYAVGDDRVVYTWDSGIVG